MMELIPVFLLNKTRSLFLSLSVHAGPVTLWIYTLSALRDLSAFIYFIPSVLFIHSAVTPVKHSARCYQFLDMIHFFGLFSPVWSPHLWPIESLLLRVPIISSSFLFPGTCLFFLHLRYTPLWGEKKKAMKIRCSRRLFGPKSMW